MNEDKAAMELTRLGNGVVQITKHDQEPGTIVLKYRGNLKL